MHSGNALRLSGVSFSYGEKEVVHDVSLTLSAGECVALMGPSGCGKSTLLLLAAGILTPGSGEVTVGDQSLRVSVDRRSAIRRDRIGLVFQFGELIAELSLRENVALAAELAGSPQKAALGAAEELLTTVGLGDLVWRLPSQVSGGQVQRTAVARAMVHRPSLVLADEPTGALDSANAEAVLDLLLHSARSLGATVLIATHDAQVAARCDRVLQVRDGRLDPEVEPTTAVAGIGAGTARP